MAVAGDGSHVAFEARKAGVVLPDLAKVGYGPLNLPLERQFNF